MASKKSLSEKISIMQVADAKSGVVYTHPEGAMQWARADNPQFNWGTSDYKIVADLPSLLVNAADITLNYTDLANKLFCLERGQKLPNATEFAHLNLIDSKNKINENILASVNVNCASLDKEALGNTDFFKILSDATGGDPNVINSCITDIQNTARVALKENIYKATQQVINDTINNQINNLKQESELYTNEAPTPEELHLIVENMSDAIAAEYHDTPDLTIINKENGPIDCTFHKNVEEGSSLTVSYNLDKKTVGVVDPTIIRKPNGDIEYNITSVTMDDLNKAIEEATSGILLEIKATTIDPEEFEVAKSKLLEKMNVDIATAALKMYEQAQAYAQKLDDAMLIEFMSMYNAFMDKTTKAINAEAEARAKAIVDLKNQIDNEVSVKLSELETTINETIQPSIEAEAAARIKGDEDEASARSQAIVDLKNQIDNEVSVKLNALETDITNNIRPAIDAKLPLAGGTMSGDILIAHATTADMSSATTNPSISFAEIGSDGKMYQKVSLVYTDYDTYRSPAGLKVIGNGSDPDGTSSPAWFEVEGDIYANAVHNAVWNDLTDLILVPDDTPLEFGRCYITDGENYGFSSEYCQKGIIGIHSDTSGLSMGEIKGAHQLHIAVAGFVLAYVDKVYESGTPLTCGENGYLTEIKMEDKLKYPERIIGTFWKKEKESTWNDISVKGRHWIKVR